MSPAPRDMPTATARYDAIRRRWIVALPDGGELAAANPYDLQALVRKHLPSTALRFARAA